MILPHLTCFHFQQGSFPAAVKPVPACVTLAKSIVTQAMTATLVDAVDGGNMESHARLTGCLYQVSGLDPYIYGSVVLIFEL